MTDQLSCSPASFGGSNLNAEGQPEKVSIRATNLFRKENGQWQMIGHHTDLLPFLEKQALTSSVE